MEKVPVADAAGTSMLVHTTALTYYDSLSCNKCHHQLLLEYLIVLSFDFGSNLSRLSELSKIFSKKMQPRIEKEQNTATGL